MTVTARITISDTDTPTPYIDPATGEWMVYDASRGDYVSTGIKAKGQKGDTGAKGEKGEQGDKGDPGAKGDKGDGLEVVDTRNDNQPPSWYRRNHPRTTVKEMKYQSTIGIPSSWRSGTYCTLETTVRYSDTSGGRVEQSTTLDNGTQLRRVGTADDTDWEPWINVSAQVREVEKGLASAKSTIAALEQAKEEIEKGKLSTSDLPAHLKWIYDAFNEGKTDSKGGLTLTQIIGLFNIDGKITAYISGRNAPGAHMLAAGVTSLADQDAVSYIDYDGSAKFGNLRISKTGTVWSYSGSQLANGQIIPALTEWGLEFVRNNNGRGIPVASIVYRDGEILITSCTIWRAKVNSFDDRLMPRVLAHGKFYRSGSLSLAVAFDSSPGSSRDSRFSCSRVSEGKYRLGFPSEWVSKYTLVFQGTEQDSQPGQSARFVSFGTPDRSGYVYVYGADDSTLNDVAVYFQIIAM